MTNPLIQDHKDRLAKLENERLKLEEDIRVAEEKKRKAYRAWDRAEAESKRDALKSDLAERSLEEVVNGGRYNDI